MSVFFGKNSRSTNHRKGTNVSSVDAEVHFQENKGVLNVVSRFSPIFCVILLHKTQNCRYFSAKDRFPICSHPQQHCYYRASQDVAWLCLDSDRGHETSVYVTNKGISEGNSIDTPTTRGNELSRMFIAASLSSHFGELNPMTSLCNSSKAYRHNI
jgi:hypothetical protein